ncbi:MAG TPA: hypothetical protein VGS58_22390 [Candidatus Sulfopaludibacter sp.]|nr:hypothetical protein [Candidatus Sulfopaludibacter sp.]
MAIQNFMLEDLVGCMKAICVFPVFVLLPGYAIAWLFDVFEFRRRTAAFRLALSTPLSIAICPIVTYLLGRFCGMAAVWSFYGAAALVFGIAMTRTPRGYRLPSEIRFVASALAIWLAIALGSLIDIQVGDRLYYPTSSLDNSVRAAFVHSISATGIPPQSPLFLPGQPVPLRYHYFWLMMCSLAEHAGGASARQALIAGTFWCGVGLMALIALYLRLFAPGDPVLLRRRILAAFLLLGITGLDILPTLFFLLLHVAGALPVVMPSVEWWNEHVDWFLYTTLWAPHALSSLIACLTGFLLLWKAPSAAGTRRLLRYGLLGGVALASSIGASIYVSFVFAVFLTVWTIVTAARKWYRETGALVVAGTACVLLASPYLLSLVGSAPAATGSGGGAPLQFAVRTFSLAPLAPGWFRLSPLGRQLFINLPLVPVNYLLEFGFFLAAAGFQLRRWRRSGAPPTRGQLAAFTMAGTSFLICTFVRSSIIGCNDLGWRGFLVAQFVLLLTGADLLAARLGVDFLSFRERRLLAVFLLLGAIGVAYDLTLTRVYPILADHGVVPPIDWMSRDRQFGKRTYAARAAYEWAQARTPESAAIQFNPNVVFQETTAMLYADRRTVAGDMGCDTTFGGDPRVCAAVIAQLQKLYPAAGAANPGIEGVCATLPIDLVVAQDTDKVWTDRQSWVWKERPLFRNRYFRVFECKADRVSLIAPAHR